MRIGFVIFPGFQMMSLAAGSVFEFANLCAGEPFYELTTLSEHGGAVRSSTGMAVDSIPFAGETFDTVLVGGGVEVPRPSDGLRAWIAGRLPGVRRLGAICTGAFVLAEAGLLDGRRATTHWLVARELGERFPAVQVEEDRIFIIDGPVWSSAGMTAGVDLALAMVEKDLGSDLARSVARKLVMYHRRGGGQTQHSELLEMTAKSDRIEAALSYARRNLTSQLSVEELAGAAALSPRQFSRAFRAETGQSPAKAVEQLRLEAARLMLEQTRHPVEIIARESGFADPERMRRAFLRAFGQPPQAMRRAARPTA
ncbi:GlxA family transcriptional regulator [Azospirillum agricola]|uniref:GlxA family transcriptional regulator n=1 Tax=Azospirillum agricola TaxID=1720247 RepID=UPI000A0EEBAC|nr:GlxA family transcriptional regulator [Azospirillum agricola]SMH39414.1 transcriptional regulator, AraC family with amidase-like domain [Azospirillum lipoferum]